MKIWPGYIQPLQDELFSSWFMRLCYEHRIKSSSFSKIYLNDTAIWNRDIDQCYPESLIETIHSHTPLSVDEIKNLFLRSYQGFLFEMAGITGYYSGINKLGIYHRTRFGFGLLYCPSCLNERISYYKKPWRLITSIVCTKCKCYLRNKCPHCSKTICFHRLENGEKELILQYPLYLCWHCKGDLREREVYYDKRDIVDEYQNYLDKTIELGYNDHTNYSFTYIRMLLYLATQLNTCSKNLNRIKLGAEERFGTKFFTNVHPKTNWSLENLGITLPVAYSLLKDWPESFISFCKEYHIRRSDFSMRMPNLPFWFERVFKESI